MTYNPYVDETDIDPDRDDPPYRRIPFNKNAIIMERQDPFGFWYMHLERGQTPKVLTGAWTTVERAMTAVRVYLKGKVKDDIILENVIENPTEVSAANPA